MSHAFAVPTAGETPLRHVENADEEVTEDVRSMGENESVDQSGPTENESLESDSSQQVPCGVNDIGAPVITATCVDEKFSTYEVTSEKDIVKPISAHVISGHFGEEKFSFSLYFPDKAQWQGRFFQYIYPLTEQAPPDSMLQANLEAGAVTVHVQGQVGHDGYRFASAVAKLARERIATYYSVDDEAIYGYLYGPSGGSYQTIGAAENTQGIWQGYIPIVLGTPASIPNNFFMRAFARFVLADDADKIRDAIRKGEKPALSPEKRAVFDEVTSLGVPLSAWEKSDYLLGQTFDDGLLGFGQTVRSIDPTYSDDFWTKDGYLGAERSSLGDVIRRKHVAEEFTVTHVEADESGTVRAVHIKNFPREASTEGLEISWKDRGGLTGTMDAESGVLTFTGDTQELATLAVGDTLRFDNSWNIALRAYYRYQVPPQSDIRPYDALRQSDGQPLYPQRHVHLGTMMSRSLAGSNHSGQFEGKMIAVSNLNDTDAFPWHADWYSHRIENSGSDNHQNFRIYFNENADHLEGEVDEQDDTYKVSYDPMVRQALVDLARWVEQGIEPAPSSAYSVEGGQVRLASSMDHGGIQPSSLLTVDTGQSSNGKVIRARTGRSIAFNLQARGATTQDIISSLEWNVQGRGGWEVRAIEPGRSVSDRYHVSFTQPGTYRVTARIASKRHNRGSELYELANLSSIWVEVVPDESNSVGPSDSIDQPHSNNATNGHVSPNSVSNGHSASPLTKRPVSAKFAQKQHQLASTGAAVATLGWVSVFVTVGGIGALLLGHRRKTEG
ncbi:hypothetical protein [Schaalia sp. ZJ1691]|uniref:hypothetical protein n=1 Tax=Schaalia sp. ZJ1691 TaxID=2709404 RepID=UPI0013ECAA2D|nr:hypothetical protein [Schaalia sp. ZJ1691]